MEKVQQPKEEPDREENPYYYLPPLYDPPYTQADVSDEEFRRMNDLCPSDCTCNGCKAAAARPQKYTGHYKKLARLYYLKYKKIPQSQNDLKCLEKMFKSSDEEKEKEEDVLVPTPPPAATEAAAEVVAAAAAQVLPPPPLTTTTIDDSEYEWSSDSTQIYNKNYLKRKRKR